MQICLFLLAEAKYVPAKLIQSTRNRQYIDIDLRLEKFDPIAKRFRKQVQDDVAFLKGDVETKNPKFEKLIERLLFVSSNYDYPILLTGNTGVGKSTLAKRIHELRKLKNRAKGEFIAVNCGTLSGDVVKSELFGHAKGSFTDAKQDRQGFLELAGEGTLFLDEIGELDPEVQKMILTAIEDKEFRRLGDAKVIKSDFYLIAGTNSDLRGKVLKKQFREDLLARIDVFHFDIPDLKDRSEDIEPNLNRELEEFSQTNNIHITMNAEARKKYLEFAHSPEATWNNNFRDLKSSVVRMAAYSKNGRIDQKVVDEEIDRLRDRWHRRASEKDRFPLARRILGDKRVEEVDLFNLAQIESVLETCLNSSTRSEAGRALFSISRLKKTKQNDAARLNGFLYNNGLDWDTIKGS